MIKLNDEPASPEIRLACGQTLNLDYPEPAVINISDIATALGNICRFGGQVTDFYSVAEHSVAMSTLAAQSGAPPEGQMACLLHDAAEAYLGDVVTPLKKQLAPIYQNYEQVIESAIEHRFGVDFARWHDTIKIFDSELYRAECVALGREHHDDLVYSIVPCFWGPKVAAVQFLMRFSLIQACISE